MDIRNLELEDYLKKDDEVIPNDHRMFRISPPPEALHFNEYIIRYQQTGDNAYFLAFLHYYENIINIKVNEYTHNYAMAEHWLDIKITIVEALLVAAQKYDVSQGKDFLAIAESYVKDAVHTYVRTMRTGFTLNNPNEDDLVRTAMREFHIRKCQTDDDTIAAISAKIDRSPKYPRKLIQDAYLNENMANAVQTDEDGNEVELSQYAPDSTSDPARLFFLMHQKEKLYEAFYSLTLREQEIISDRLGFCPECWTQRLRKDGTILRRDFNYIGLTHEIREKAAERAYHNALDKIREYITHINKACPSAGSTKAKKPAGPT